MSRKKAIVSLLAAMVGMGFLLAQNIPAYAAEFDDPFISAGISAILNPTAPPPVTYEYPEYFAASESLGINQKFEKEQQRIGEELAMANVQSALNVRAEPDESSEKVGVLYKDCGGIILDRVEGWIKIKSGDVIGWAKEEFMLTGEDAQQMADDVGNWIVTIDTDVVRVREEPSMEPEVEILGLIAYDDNLSIIEVMDDEWISVDYDGQVGFVAAECIDVRYYIDEGETMEVIREREAKEAERRRTANRGKVDASADELRLLAALIYCEAGNQSYEGKLGVGAVVMNRVRSSAYPNTIHGVIYASGQFTPAISGKVARVYEGNNIPQSCLNAAQAAINGETTVGGATRFRRAGSREGLVIGAHVFW
ncbi:MAG: cell wall hydrolase [Lachnospiraceae bacterium]|jgi:hypothetical protein|nr:cell wall hydrolase [Lachnospiraceae bacterium]